MIADEKITELEDAIVDLQCRSMKNNLIFTNLLEHPEEDTERKLRIFIHDELGIEHHIAFGNVHRFGKKTNGKIRPIVARFIHHRDLRQVLDNATWLRDTRFGVHEQFPKVIEDKRRKLYPVLKQAKRERKNAVLVRDRLYINGVQFIPDDETIQQDTQQSTGSKAINSFRDAILATPRQTERPFKHQRQSDSSTPDRDRVNGAY